MKYEYASTMTVTHTVPAISTEFDMAGKKTAAITASAPAATNNRPPNRCVRSHTRSLDSVHGVRMPTNQFDLMRGMRLPSTISSRPMPAGIRRAIDTSLPSAAASSTR